MSRRTSLLIALALPVLASSDVEPRYDHSGFGTGLNGAVEEAGVWTRYDTIVLLHGICGMAAWQVISPLAVVVAAVGRSWGPVWFHLHWTLQLLAVVPLTVATVVLGTVANKLGDGNGYDRHKILGFIILAVLWIQLAVGFLAHRDTKSSQPAPQEPSTSSHLSEARTRSLSGYLHIVLGITLLALGGLQITWGLYGEYTSKPIPTWILILHWILAGIPLAIVVPYILIRGCVRMRRGQPFSSAFLNRAPSPRFQPPRKLWLHESRYMEMGEGEGFEYARGGGVGGSQAISTGGADGVRWEGPSTREEYEEKIRGEGVRATSLYDSTYEGTTMTTDGVEDEDFAAEGTSLLMTPVGGKASSEERSDTYSGRADIGHSPISTISISTSSQPASTFLHTPPSYPPTRPNTSTNTCDHQTAFNNPAPLSFPPPPSFPTPPPAPSATSSSSSFILPEITSTFPTPTPPRILPPPPSTHLTTSSPLPLPSPPTATSQPDPSGSPASPIFAPILPLQPRRKNIVSAFYTPTTSSPVLVPGIPTHSPETITVGARVASLQGSIGGATSGHGHSRAGAISPITSEGGLPFPGEGPRSPRSEAPSVLSVNVGVGSQEGDDEQEGERQGRLSQSTFGVRRKRSREELDGVEEGEGEGKEEDGSVVSVATGKWMAGGL